jgi:hypothetical protein
LFCTVKEKLEWIQMADEDQLFESLQAFIEGYWSRTIEWHISGLRAADF